MHFADQTVLITGGTGSWGQELTKQLLDRNVKQIRIFSRNEDKQVLMKRLFNDSKLKFILGDVRDCDSIDYASRGVDTIFHLAAIKHVPICEELPSEAIKINVVGTKNVIDASIKNRVSKVIDVSSDKAVAPLNVYGFTKALGERLMIQANQLSDYTRFVCIRGGNVLGTSGSVVPLFIQQIKEKNTMTVTDVRMTRYFLTIHDAIQLLITASLTGLGGETFVMNMPSFYINTIAQILKEEFGNNDTIIQQTGIRAGEKLKELLITEHETRNAYILNDDYYMILPSIEIKGLQNIWSNSLNKVYFKEYSSNTNLKTKEEARELLKRGGYIK
jgi:UDP-N-acetylglucosamine 4,6-dehydratase/5-epimerase